MRRHLLLPLPHTSLCQSPSLGKGRGRNKSSLNEAVPTTIHQDLALCESQGQGQRPQPRPPAAQGHPCRSESPATWSSGKLFLN